MRQSVLLFILVFIGPIGKTSTGVYILWLTGNMRQLVIFSLGPPGKTSVGNFYKKGKSSFLSTEENRLNALIKGKSSFIGWLMSSQLSGHAGCVLVKWLVFLRLTAPSYIRLVKSYL